MWGQAPRAQTNAQAPRTADPLLQPLHPLLTQRNYIIDPDTRRPHNPPERRTKT